MISSHAVDDDGLKPEMLPIYRCCLLLFGLTTTVLESTDLRAQQPAASPDGPGGRTPRESPVRRGSIQAGGAASFTHTRDRGTDFEWTTLDLMPRAGYFVLRGLAVNLNLRHRRIWNEDRATVRDETFSEWGAGPGLSYFVTTRFPRVFPFVSGRTMFSRTLNTADIYSSPQSPEPAIDDREARSRSRIWQVSGGVMYMVGSHVGLTGEAFYQRTRVTLEPGTPAESSNSAETFGLQWGFATFIF